MKFIKILFSIILIIVVILALVGGYLGLVPGVSALFGSNKSKDLGVMASQQAFDSGNKKIMLQRVEIDATPGMPDLLYQGSHVVNAALSSEEITSLMQKGFYKYNPIADSFQMKINSDGSVEISGILDLRKLKHYVADAGLGNIDQYAQKYGLLVSQLPFYASGTASVSNNSASLNFTTIQIGRISIPVSSQIDQGADALIDQRIQKISGMSIKSLTFSQGQMNLSGNFPDKLQVAK
jgi:hypothetical protein